MTATVAEAKTWAAGGFLFSDEMGGFTILSVTGRGTVAEPIVIVEELTDIGPAILVIRIDKSEPPPSGPQLRPTYVNAALVKIVTNASKRVWVGFDLELRQDLRKPSPYGDGPRSTPVDTPSRSNRSTTSSVATLPDAPGA